MAKDFRTKTIQVTTGGRPRVVDLTGQIETFLDRAEAREGLLNVFVPHATAGVALIETGAGSDEDLIDALEAILPRDDRWRHRHGSTGHGADHVLPGLVAPHATVPVVSGRPTLGTWQSICLVDTNTDNTERTVRFTFLG